MNKIDLLFSDDLVTVEKAGKNYLVNVNNYHNYLTFLMQHLPSFTHIDSYIYIKSKELDRIDDKFLSLAGQTEEDFKSCKDVLNVYTGQHGRICRGEKGQIKLDYARTEFGGNMVARVYVEFFNEVSAVFPWEIAKIMTLEEGINEILDMLTGNITVDDIICIKNKLTAMKEKKS